MPASTRPAQTGAADGLLKWSTPPGATEEEAQLAPEQEPTDTVPQPTEQGIEQAYRIPDIPAPVSYTHLRAHETR
eukprot:670629-Prorocentrum_lima.AAC.1